MRYRFVILLLCSWFCISAQDTIHPESVPSSVVQHKVESAKKEKENHLVNVDSVLLKKPVTTQRASSRDFSNDYRNRYSGNDFNYTTIKPKESIMERVFRNI